MKPTNYSRLIPREQVFASMVSLALSAVLAEPLLVAGDPAADAAAQVVSRKGDAGGKRFDGIAEVNPNQWHNLKLRFVGTTIIGLVDDKIVLSATDNLYSHGMAGLMAGGDKQKFSTPYFDDVLIKGIHAP